MINKFDNIYLVKCQVDVNKDQVALHSDKTPEIAPLFDLDAKFLLHPILKHFHINKYKLAEEIRLDEMHEDVICLCREIMSL